MDIAYAYYRQNDQAQGLAAVDRFIKLHPNHPNVDYMYYLRGLINFNDRTSIFDTSPIRTTPSAIPRPYATPSTRSSCWPNASRTVPTHRTRFCA